jgi:hypothetical protein
MGMAWARRAEPFWSGIAGSGRAADLQDAGKLEMANGELRKVFTKRILTANEKYVDWFEPD